MVKKSFGNARFTRIYKIGMARTTLNGFFLHYTPEYRMINLAVEMSNIGI